MTEQHERPIASPLDVALLHFRVVEAFADKYGGDDPDAQMRAFIEHAGPRQWHYAQSAACMAAVSIAEDLHRLVDHLAGPCERHT